MDVRVVRRGLDGTEPPCARRGRRPRDGPPQLRDHGPALGRIRGADRYGDDRDDEGTVLVHGGPDFAQSLTRLGLVDEYQLSTVPIAIGAGRSPFAKLDEHLKLDVVEEERFSSGALAQILVPKP